jgi:hypothetical protein
MTDEPALQSGVFGRAPDEWEQVLFAALDRRDHQRLRRALRLLQQEIRAQDDQVDRRAHAPALDRLVEQARRLLAAAPTEGQALQDELAAERGIWSGFRQRYRDELVPSPLRPFLGSSALFVAPAADPPTFAGFDKYHGLGGGDPGEAVTLFHQRTLVGVHVAASTPPNFFSSFSPRRGRFVVQRAYRTSLPRGAGAACILEHLRALVPDATALRGLSFDNVQNSASYRAHVDHVDGVPTLRRGVPVDGSPLGRLGARLLTELGLEPAGVRSTLDGFGFLDLVIDVR